MRFVFLFLAVFLLRPASGQGVVFQAKGWATLLKRAKAEDKLIFVDVYTTWCGPCRWMNQNVFADPQVGQLVNQELLGFKADAERGEGAALAGKFGVRSYPTFLFVNGEGDVVHRIRGLRQKPQFLSEVRLVLTEKNGLTSLKRMDKEARQYRQDALWLHEYLSSRVRFTHLENGALAERYLALLPAESLRSPEILRLLSQVQFAPDSKAFETLLVHHAAAEAALDEAGQPGNAVLRAAFQRMLFNQLTQSIRHEVRSPLDKALVANERILQTAPHLSEVSSPALEMTYFLQMERFNKFINLARKHLDGEGSRQTPQTLASVDSAGLAAFLTPYQSGQADSTKNHPAFRQSYAYWQHRQANRYAADLSLAAQGCLDLAATPEHLTLGLGWITRAIEINQHPNWLVTCAQLLKRLGRDALAKRTMARAMSQAHEEGASDDYIAWLEDQWEKLNLSPSEVLNREIQIIGKP